MKTLLALLCLSALALAADDQQLAELEAVDANRITAFQTADAPKLAALLSDDLRYAHSSGNVDDKTSLTASLISRKIKYTGFEYQERKFTFPAPGIALMTGKAHVTATTTTGGMDSVLAFLAVWREEKGEWRFLAWQSCKLPPPEPAK